MEKKLISELTNEEILRRMLEVLAEYSQQYCAEELPNFAHAMVEVYKALKGN